MFNSSFWWCAHQLCCTTRYFFRLKIPPPPPQTKEFFVHVAGGWCPWNPQLSQKEAQKWAVAFLIDWRLLENVFSFPFEELLILEFDMGGGNWKLIFLVNIELVFKFNLKVSDSQLNCGCKYGLARLSSYILRNPCLFSHLLA